MPRLDYSYGIIHCSSIAGFAVGRRFGVLLSLDWTNLRFEAKSGFSKRFYRIQGQLDVFSSSAIWAFLTMVVYSAVELIFAHIWYQCWKANEA
jgi:hypothetical protein